MVIEKSQNKSFFFLCGTGATEEKLSTNCKRPFLGEGKLQKSPYFEF
jgi:hypothetical protein